MTETLMQDQTQHSEMCTEDISQMSEGERLARRREKFGIFSIEDEATKKIRRAQRFEISTAETEALKMQQRAERFGSATSTNSANAEIGVVVADRDEVARRKRRAERFGIVTPEDEAKRKQARAERFDLSRSTMRESTSGTTEESLEAKLAARILRFGTTGSSKTHK